MDEAQNQEKSPYLLIFDILLSAIFQFVTIGRGFFIIIENHEEVNHALIWASTLSLGTLIGIILYFRKNVTYYDFFMNISIVNIIAWIFTVK